MVYYKSYAYLLVKTLRDDELFIKLIAIDMRKLETGRFLQEDIKGIDIGLYKNGKKETFKARQHLSSRF